jgi:tRNA threonylcarbamoyladenosine biosynthesis protein TsaB
VIVLGIETSTRQTSVAIGDDREILAHVGVSASPGQEVVIPALQKLLRWSGSELSHVGGVAVGIGPGLFTSLRVGIATAKSLAQALRIPVVGLGSMDVLAYEARVTHRTIATVIDARRGEVFFALYRPVPGGVVRERDPAVATPDQLVAELDSIPGDVLAVGNGAILYQDEIARSGTNVALASPLMAHPSASAIIELAVPRFLREDFGRLFEIVPLYLRKSDAEIAWDERHRGAPARDH